MKVIKKAPPWTYQLTCKHCQSELEIKERDVHYDPGSDYPVARATAYYVDCPVCKRTPNISPKDLPVTVRDKAEDRTRRLNQKK